MNLTSLVGFILAWLSVVICLIEEGAKFGAFFKLAPGILVFGGTFGATMLGFSLHELKQIPAKVQKVFFYKEKAHMELIKQMVEFANKSRRDGVLALEESIETLKDDFLVKGLQMLVDGVDNARIQSTLETDILMLKTWYKEGEEFFKAAGGYGPTLGIIGTVFGLVTMLADLSNAEAMGPAIASAFIATLYGISSANLIYLPIATKMKNISAAEQLEKRIILEGLLCIQAGVNPRMTEQTLLSYVYPHKKEAESAAK